MPIEIRIAGPDLDVVYTLAEGDPELLLGRDHGCDVCLPDPERVVSRRHLVLWASGGELHFHVLSEVNGIEMPFGEAPPGARGVLPLGQCLKVGSYEVRGAAVDRDEKDPWLVLEREGSGIGSAQASLTASQADPFAETFGPGGSGQSQETGALASADTAAFFRGLGVEAGSMTGGELEATGRLVRVLALGILDLHAEVADLKQELRSEDRTMVAFRDNNPLKTDWPAEAKLRYLFGGGRAAAGCLPPERALRELVADLIAHNAASAAAARATVAGTLREHAPATLKARLIGDGMKLFESGRAWDAFCKYYEEQGADMDSWVQRLLDRYFAEAYLLDGQRMRRDTAQRDR